MIRKLGAYGAGLIALYLLVAKGSGGGTLLTAGANGVAVDVKAFQGR